MEKPTLNQLALGALAGLAATYAMTAFQNHPGQRLKKILKISTDDSTDKPSTVRVAQKAYSLIRHKPLPESKENAAGTLVHYTFGALMGSAFGFYRNLIPISTPLSGLLYGTVVWFFADELGTATAKLAPPPWKAKKGPQFYGWVSHLAYGLALANAHKIEEKIAA